MVKLNFTKPKHALTSEEVTPQLSNCHVAIIDYEFGNVRSVTNALESLGVNVSLTRDMALLKKADCLILPGVGAFQDGMKNLERLQLVSLLNQLVLDEKKPILGICVGMQLMASQGNENGTYPGLGWIDAEVVRFPNSELKVPHVGWNDAKTISESPITTEQGALHSYYFVHSFYLACNNYQDVKAECDYGTIFPAIIQRDNIFAVQFHPEKSQKHGLTLLKNFLTSCLKKD